MRYLSVCSGIEAATVAWEPLGFKPIAFSEIEPFPRAILQYHFSHVPLHGDFTTITGDQYGPVDLVIGGTPPVGWFGKMSPVFCQIMEDGTLVPSSGRWQNSGMGGPTESWTLSTSEYPSDAAVCSLSDVLETQIPPQRYWLSAKACTGILRRNAKRGRKLPSALRAALEAAATTPQWKPTSPEP